MLRWGNYYRIPVSHIPKMLDSTGLPPQEPLAIRTANRIEIASAVTSGVGLVNCVKTNCELEDSKEEVEEASICKSKAAPRQRMGCLTIDRAKRDGT